MKIDLFENKYRPSNAMKIFFIDIVSFLLVCAVSLGMCYAYLSNKAKAGGTSTMGHVDVEYQYEVTNGNYQSVDDVYIKLNDSTTAQTLGSLTSPLNPGDKLTIVGRAVNTSNVDVFVLARVQIDYTKNGVDGSEVLWFNIGDNAPSYDENGNLIGTETNGSLDEEDYIKLATADMVNNNDGQTYKVFQTGASVLGASVEKNGDTYYHYKELAIPVTINTELQNGDKVNKITLTLAVHQREYLDTADDFNELYKPLATGITEQNPNGFINGYATESIYAAHYITGNKLIKSI